MKKSFKDFNEWLLDEQGIRLTRFIKEAIPDFFSSLKGNTFLQLGIEEHQSWLADINIEKKMICIASQGKSKASVVASMYELPFDTASVDVIFCPFTLNFLHHKVSFLSEIDRVLSHDGNVVFCGINPFSLWGLNYLCGYPPYVSDLMSVHALRKYLFDLDYVINDVKHFIYWPPFVKKLFLERVFEKFGQMILPYPAGFYLLSAKKNIYNPIVHRAPVFLEKSFN